MTEASGLGITSEHWAAIERLIIDGAVAEVAGGLRGAGIEVVLLKGRSVAGWLYDAHETRPYADGDLLINVVDRTCAEEMLGRLGFQPDRDTSWIQGWDDPGQPWRRVRDGVTIDLHVSIAGVGVEPGRLWEVLSGELEPMAFGDTTITVLTPAARALHLALHVTQHDGNLARPLHDLELAVARLEPAIWQHAASLAAQLGATPALALGLTAVPGGAELASDLELPTEREARRLIQRTRLTAALRALRAEPSNRNRLRMLTAKILPSPAFMRGWHRLGDRGPFGLVIAYAWRPLWLLGRATLATLTRVRAYARRSEFSSRR